MNWRWWKYKVKHPTAKKPCAAWDPPDGSYGRDTHICRLWRKHSGKHRCKCGASWEGPNRR